MTETILAVSAASWGIIMGVSPALQIRRMLRTRSSRDVSIGYFGILLPGFVLWLTYGLVIDNAALVVSNAVALSVALATVAVALRLRHESHA